MLVAGQAGHGKTVLLGAVEAEARARGMTVFHGAGDVAGQVIPFGPLLEALVSAPGAPVDPAVLRDLSHSPDQRFWLLREMQEALERAALRAPVLISLDDVQWADPATLAALGSLTRQLAGHRILWLLAVRSGELGATEHTALLRLQTSDTLEITVGPLDEGAVAGVAADLLGAAPDPALLTALAEVGGQPFLLTELLRGLREEKLVEVRDGSARLVRAGLPLDRRNSVGYRFDRLSAGARDTLQLASVLGRRFSADELTALGGAAPAEVLAALREALAAGLVIEDGDRMTFRHDLVREAADAALPRTVRQSLRRRAVDVMLRHGAPPSDVAELVMDVARPGDREAIAILRRAAAETGRVSPAVAALLSRRALDLTPPGDPSRGPLTVETLRYLVYAGKAAEGVRLMTAAAGDFADPAAEAEARLSLAHLCMQYASADVVDQCRRALDLPDVPDRVRIHLLSFLSLGLDLFGDASAAEKTVQDAIEAAKASDDHENEVFTLIPRAAQALGDGDWRLALDLAAESVARRHSVQGETVRLWLPDAWQALISISLGRLDEALALIDAGMQAAQRDGIAANIRVWSMLRFRALFSAGRLADARAEAEATIEMADEIGDGSSGYINHVAQYILGRVALHTGDSAGLAQAGRTAARLRQPRESVASQRLGGWLAALLADAGGGPPAARAPVQLLDPLAAGPLSTTSPLAYADTAALTRALLDAGRRPTRRRWSPGWRTSPPVIATSRSSRRPRCTPARCSTATPTSRCRRWRAAAATPGRWSERRCSRTPGACSPPAARRRRCRCLRPRSDATAARGPSGTRPGCAACCGLAGSVRRQAGPGRRPTGPSSPSPSSPWSAWWRAVRPTGRWPNASSCPRTRSARTYGTCSPSSASGPGPSWPTSRPRAEGRF